MEYIRQGLDIDKLIFIGHSMGGIIASLYTATYPEHIIKTVTIDSIFPRDSSTSEVGIYIYLQIYPKTNKLVKY